MRLATVLKSEGLEKSTPVKIKGETKRARYWMGIKVNRPPIL
jgi:hypothetical protein